MEDWVVVVDKDEHSTAQIDACRAHDVGFRGVVRCGDAENGTTPLCSSVDAFPAFCHVRTNACVYGLRTERADLEALVNLAGSSPRTTS